MACRRAGNAFVHPLLVLWILSIRLSGSSYTYKYTTLLPLASLAEERPLIPRPRSRGIILSCSRASLLEIHVHLKKTNPFFYVKIQFHFQSWLAPMSIAESLLKYAYKYTHQLIRPWQMLNSSTLRWPLLVACPPQIIIICACCAPLRVSVSVW